MCRKDSAGANLIAGLFPSEVDQGIRHAAAICLEPGLIFLPQDNVHVLIASTRQGVKTRT